MSEEQLVAACKKGKPQAQEQLYTQYSRAMYVVCLRYTRSQQEAEDVLQESFIKVFAKIDQYKGDVSVGGWIKKIVVNTALNSQRSKLYMFPMTDVEEMREELNDDFSLSEFQLEELLQMIRSLPEGCQVIFNLYAIEGYSHKEIAKQLGVSEGTSKSQYARARQLLREMIYNEERRSYEQAR